MELHTIHNKCHKNGYTVGEHSHNYYELVYYLSGSGEIFIDSEQFLYSANTFSISRPQSPHKEQSKRNVNLMYIGFSLDKDFDSDFLKNGVYSCSKEDHILTILKEIDYENTTKGFFYDDQIRNLLSNLLLLVKRSVLKKQSKANELFNVRDYICKNANKNLNAKVLAKIFNYNYDYFRKEFKKYFNVSINDFILTEQVNYATKLISSTSLSIAEVAKQSGFSSTSHFINCFKKQYNITPKKWIVRDVKG